MADVPTLLERSRECAREAEVYVERHQRYGVNSYLVIARELIVISHLWLVRAERQNRRMQARLRKL